MPGPVCVYQCLLLQYLLLQTGGSGSGRAAVRPGLRLPVAGVCASVCVCVTVYYCGYQSRFVETFVEFARNAGRVCAGGAVICVTQRPVVKQPQLC